MNKDMRLDVYARSCMNLHLTEAHKILDQKQRAIRLLYASCTKDSSVYLIMLYKGSKAIIPPIINVIFSPLFIYENYIDVCHSVPISEKELHLVLNQSEIEDIYYVLDFVIYMNKCISKYNNKLRALVDEFVSMHKEPGMYVGYDKLIISGDSPFYGISTISHDYDVCRIAMEKLPRLKKMERKVQKIEKKLLDDLNLVSILGVIPN